MKYNLLAVPLAVLLGWAASGRCAEGESLVAEAARQLLRQPSLEAKIRQRVDLFGQQLVGSGIYRQLFEGRERRVRLELKLQAAGQATSMQQVSNGRFLYIRRDWPNQKSLSRVDLQRIREAFQDAPDQPFTDSTTVWMALGGLPKLLSSLDENFQFRKPQPDHIGQLPVWVLDGRWKTEKLVQLLPDQKADILAGKPPRVDQLPAHLPDSVTLVLGRDESIPLFPYRITYRRQSAIQTSDGGVLAALGPEQNGVSSSIVTIELFEVRGRLPLDRRQFDYQAGEQEIVNHTELFLQRLGLSPAETVDGA